MKYISLINRFWSLNAVEPFGRTDTAVYLYLLNQCNLRHWQNPFTITLHQIEVAVNVTRKTVSASLKRLQKRGLLATKSRRYLPTTVILADSDSLFKAQSKSTLRETSVQLSGTHQAHKTTHIKRVKNINDKQLKKHSIECKKSEQKIKKNPPSRPLQPRSYLRSHLRSRPDLRAGHPNSRRLFTSNPYPRSEIGGLPAKTPVTARSPSGPSQQPPPLYPPPYPHPEIGGLPAKPPVTARSPGGPFQQPQPHLSRSGCECRGILLFLQKTFVS